MASRTFLFLALIAFTVSVVLSIPQLNPMAQYESQGNPHLAVEPQPNEPHQEPDNIKLPNINPRTFGTLFNLSAYLAGAPNDSAALNFIPLITILSALG